MIRKDCYLNGYRARSGVIETGAVTVGAGAFVGEQTVLDIGTTLGDGAQLGHASALHAGQAVPAGQGWHGSPAQPAGARLRLPDRAAGPLRHPAPGHHLHRPAAAGGRRHRRRWRQPRRRCCCPTPAMLTHLLAGRPDDELGVRAGRGGDLRGRRSSA